MRRRPIVCCASSVPLQFPLHAVERVRVRLQWVFFSIGHSCRANKEEEKRKNMRRMKQSVSWWSFAQGALLPQTLLHAAADNGYRSMELVDQEYWPLIKEHGLSIVSTAAGLSIEQGLNRREHHAHLEQKIRAALHLAEQWSIPTIIVFSGNRQGLSDQAGIEITAEGLSRVAQAAEDAGVTLAIELLNSKVDHLDYQWDHTALGVEVFRLVHYPRVSRLYAIYHIQIM